MLNGTLIAAELGKIQPPSSAYAPAADTGEAAATTLELMISMGLGGVTIVAGLYFVLNFVISALNWLGSSGDTSKIQKARDSITHSLVGLIIVIASYGVIGLIGSIMGLNLLSPGKALLDIAP